MRLRFFILILMAGLFGTGILRAQQPVFQVLDYTVGLPSNTVYSLRQDKKGYIWIGHDKGLTRYNGSEYMNFSNNMTQSRALSNIEEDYYGTIWCQNFSGEIFYTQQDSLKLMNRFGSVGNYVFQTVWGGKHLVTVRNGALLDYNVETKRVIAHQQPGIQLSPTNMLANGNSLLAYTNDPSVMVEIKGLTEFRTLKLPAELKPLIYIYGDGRYFLLPRNGLDASGYVENGAFTVTKLGIKSIIQNASFIGGNLWIATSEGLYVFDKNMHPVYGNKPLFPDLNASCIIQDHEGSIWVSTLNRGVIVLSNLNVQLLTYNQVSFTNASYFSSTDKIILGTGDNRLYEFNPKNLDFKLLYDFEFRHDVVNIYNDVSNDLIWISSDKMYALRPGSNIVEYKKPYPLKDIQFLGGGTYAIAGPEGVSLFSYSGDTIGNEYSDMFLNSGNKWYGERQLLAGTQGRAKCLAWEPVSKTLYASNYKGLFVWSPGYKGVITAHGEPIYATDIIVKGNKVYVVTYNGSLYIINGHQIEKEIRSFPGLERKTITTIDYFGDNLWVLYENAIVKYDIFTGAYRVFRTSDGLPNVEIKDIVVFDGKVYLATRIGLVLFPENMPNSRVSPRIEVEQIFVNKIPVDANSNLFELKTSQNNLEIHFGMLSYRVNSNIQLYYKINNKSWIPLGPKSTTLNLIGLSPGRYDIRIKAMRQDGTEVMLSRILRFDIAAPLWSRWWFILLVILIIGFLAYSFMRFRIAELRKESEFKAARDRLEKELQLSILTSIKSQMNPHFVFNALNTVQSYIFTNDKDNAIDYLNKFSDLTRMILDMSNKEKIPLSEEIRALSLYLELEKKRFEDNFSYQLIVNEKISPELMSIPSMLIQPYVENAIKHGLLHKVGERRLKVEFVREGNALVVFIDDNGVGRKKSYEIKMAKPTGHKSFATEANKKRLQLLNQGKSNPIDIEYLDKMDSFGNSEGTMVILAIPINF